MNAYIAFTIAAALAFGGYVVGWWHCNRRARVDLADVRTTLTAQVDTANKAAKAAGEAAVKAATMLGSTRRELDEMTRAHHRGAEEYERLLEAWRAVPEAFRAPLRVLDERRDVITPVEMLFDAYDVPRPDADAAEAARLAAMLDAPTDVWKRVVYRPVPAADTTVHEGELLDKAGVTLVPAGRTYPAQRHGKGKRR